MFQLITPERCTRLRRQITYGRHALAMLLAATLALPAHSYAAPQPNATTTASHIFDHAEREQRLTQALAAIGNLRSSLNRSTFDTEALLESLDYDPDTIIDFVRDEIRFEPYEGLLRGIQGTLMSRAGNALDQSLLLAYLLGEAGADARIAHGRLNQEQALLLVRSLRGAAAPEPAVEGPDLVSYLKEFARAAGADEAAIEDLVQSLEDTPGPQEHPIWDAAETGRDYLLKHLNKSDLTLEPADAEPGLAAQSLNYFWVEYKDGANDPWQRVHTLAAADTFDEQTVPALERLTESVPAHFQHRLRITAKLERQVAGSIEVINLMQAWERPVANLLDQHLSFANQPNGIQSLDDFQDLSQIEARTTLLIPTLNGQPAPGAQAFDLRGRTIALDALKMDSLGAAALFQTAGDKTLEAADALSGLSFGKPGQTDTATTAYSLRRVWLEYTSIHPNGTERVDQRTIWQAPAAMSPAASSALWELVTPHSIGVATSEYPSDYLLDLELARLQSLEPVLRWASETLDIPPGQSLPAPPDPGPAAAGLPELAYLHQFDAGINPDNAHLMAYRSEPTIVVSRQGLRNANGNTTAYADVDIMHNRRTVLRTDAPVLQTDPAEAIRLGAWDTLVEQQELQNRRSFMPGSETDIIVSSNRMYQDPKNRDQAPLMLRDLEELAALPDTDLAASSRLALAEDLQRGYVVLMETPQHPQPLVWWRIHPDTGETLGRGLDGRGQAISESANVMTIISASTSLIGGTGMCYASNNSCGLAKCFATSFVVTGATTGLGMAGTALLAAKTTGIALAISSLFAVGLIGLSLASSPVANVLPKTLPSCFWK